MLRRIGARTSEVRMDWTDTRCSRYIRSERQLLYTAKPDNLSFM